MPTSALLDADEEQGRSRRSGGKRSKGHSRQALAPARKTHAEIDPPITVRTLSEAIGVKANEIIRKLMNNLGQLVTINANLDEETAQMLAMEFGVELEVVYEHTAEDDLLTSFEASPDDPEMLKPRPPVITILGHVDHGKTSLLDRIRRSDVAAHETGGITQHIGAYQIEHEGHKITFVDTPGHEAFTAMRARGANVTDIVVLVVAADDGVMPQTKEAIAHAKAAGVPIVVALNKVDLPGINYNKIYGELSQEELVPEEYGGDTPVVKTSALTGQGVPELLEMLGIIAELRDLKTNPDRLATGTCLEASVSEGRGVTATVLVQDGTLRVGDAMVCGEAYGRVRALFDDRGQAITEAPPSTPVEVSGLDSVPSAGEKFGVVEDITMAREIAETRRARGRGVGTTERPAITLENLYTRVAEKKVKTLNLILKADVQGSLEALIKELEKLENAEVPIRVLHKAVGGIGESDIILADASQAIVIGFRVAPDDRALSLAEEKNVEVRRYDIIYQVTDEIKKAVEGLLVPEVKEVHLGRAVVRQAFKISKVGTVAGCFVTQGTIERAAKVRLIREGREIYKGSIEALKRFKDDVREVREGFECGIKIANFDDIKPDDTIEAYRIDVIRRTL
jgi:translation initiation factor IF-2